MCDFLLDILNLTIIQQTKRNLGRNFLKYFFSDQSNNFMQASKQKKKEWQDARKYSLLKQDMPAKKLILIS